MTSLPRHDLLQPSLGGSARLAAAPYSLGTGMWSAFFGGPLAATALIGINAWRVGRLRRDAVWVVLLAMAYVAWTFFLHATPAGAEARSTLVSWLGSRGPAYCDRFIALMSFAGGMLLHRSEQRSADLFGLKRPNGWIMGVALIVCGVVAGDLLIFWVTR
jgi:hypothetical protein